MAYGEQMTPILALSFLLAAGFAVAVLARAIRLPSVTGYVVAGILIGPSGLDLIPERVLEAELTVFTGIALMLVAFGIGERFDLQQLAQSARAVARVSSGESLCTFAAVGVGVGAVAWLTRAGSEYASPGVWVATSLVCAAIAVATAPASTAAVIREVRASGPLSRLTLATVVVDNALSITLFGLGVGAAKVLLGTTSEAWLQLGRPVVDTVAALTLGLLVGLATDFVVHKLSRPNDVLIAALASVFFTGGMASFLGLSPLLAGVAAGFAVVNRDRRDVRAFRALNDFEPPLYAIFFTLAGAELRWQEMLAGGAVALTFILGRGIGKYLGARLGARSAQLPAEHSSLIGLGLLPQAGLAIGLALLVSQDPGLLPIRALVISVTVASVVVNELIGPPLLRMVLTRIGEASEPAADVDAGAGLPVASDVDLVPWRWPKLTPTPSPDGYVLAALGSRATAAVLVRVATLLSHHLGARPLGVYVSTTPAAPGDFWGEADAAEAADRFRLAHAEATEMGYSLQTRRQFSADAASGLLACADRYGARAIVLGHPMARKVRLFGRVVDAVAQEAPCPVIVVKFVGTLHTERILVPVTGKADFHVLQPVVSSLSAAGEHRVTVLRLMPSEVGEGELRAAREDPEALAFCRSLPSPAEYDTIAPQSRVHDILEASLTQDIVVMATGTQRGLGRLFFGSLAEDVAVRTRRSMLVVCAGPAQAENER